MRLTVPSTQSTTIRPFKSIQWRPQSDISAHELAELMPLLISIAMRPLNYWEDYIPTEARRHFEIKDQK